MPCSAVRAVAGIAPACSRSTPSGRRAAFAAGSGRVVACRAFVAVHDVITRIGNTEIRGWDQAKYTAGLTATGYPAKIDLTRVNWFMAEVLLVIMVIYVTMVYGPIAAFLVELFPTQIRYTSMSLPYHIGNGWFGGMLPLLATAIVAWTGNIYAGLYYPIGVALITVVIGFFFLGETKDTDISESSGVEAQAGS